MKEFIMLIFLVFVIVSFMELASAVRRSVSFSSSSSSSSSSQHHWDSCFQVSTDIIQQDSIKTMLKARQRHGGKTYAMKMYVSQHRQAEELNSLLILGKRLKDPQLRQFFYLLSPEFQEPLCFNLERSLLPDESPSLLRTRSVGEMIYHLSYRPLKCVLIGGGCLSLPKLPPLSPTNDVTTWAAQLHHKKISALVFPICDGGSLQKLLSNVASGKQQLTDGDCFLLALGIVRALQALHSMGYVHLDLTPANILLNSSKPISASGIGTPVLTEFGLAKEIRRHCFENDKTTLGYKAPESESSQRVSASADVFSFGSVLQQLRLRTNLRGSKLVAQQMLKSISGSASEDLVDRCWSRDSSKRPSLEEIMKELEQKFLAWLKTV